MSVSMNPANGSRSQASLSPRRDSSKGACGDCCEVCLGLSAIISFTALPILACLAVTAGASFGISFGVKNFKPVHLAAKILIPLTITIITTIAAIAIHIHVLRCCCSKCFY